MVYLRQGDFDVAVQVFQRGVRECPFGRDRLFSRTALATVKLQLRDYAAAEAAIDTIEDEGELPDVVASIRTQIFGMRDKFDRAAESYRRLRLPTTALASELFAELERRFVDRRPAEHSDDWLIDCQIRFQMQCQSMAA